jgi:hypothetical protein
MNPLFNKSSAFLFLAFSLAACGGSADDGTEEAIIDEPPPASDGCDPTGKIPCYDRIAEPCKDINSGYPGDELCLAPPDPEVGLQAHVGPLDYTDPDQVEKYLIYPGQETNWAEVTSTPNPETVYTRGYHSHMRPGSHHFIMFGMGADTAVSGKSENGSGAESAVGALGGTFLGGATRAIQNIDTRTDFPEDQGIGSEIIPNRPVAMNVHFINTEDQPLIQELWVNFILIDEAEVTKYVKPITWYGGFFMNIAPGAHQLLRNGPNSCGAPDDVRIGMLTGHVHANTNRITTTMTPAGSTEASLLFEDYDWHEPTEWRFNQAVTNAAPDAEKATGGAANGVINVGAGDSFNWECDVENRSNVTLKFSNKVYDGEMCNVFGFYFTEKKEAAPWTCVF